MQNNGVRSFYVTSALLKYNHGQTTQTGIRKGYLSCYLKRVSMEIWTKGQHSLLIILKDTAPFFLFRISVLRRQNIKTLVYNLSAAAYSSLFSRLIRLESTFRICLVSLINLPGSDFIDVGVNQR